MLLPFERNLFNIDDFKGSYITTLINDIFRFEDLSGGLVLCAAPEKTGYILFRNGKILNVCAFSNDQGNNIPRQVPFQSFFDLASIDIYVNAIEDASMIEDINSLLCTPVMFAAPADLADMNRLIGYIKDKSVSGTMGFKHGAVLNTAFFANGSFTGLSYYHSGTMSYATERTEPAFRNYLAANEKLAPYVFFKARTGQSSADRKELSLFQNDPVLAMFMCYVDIFDIIFKAVREKIDENRLSEVCGVLFKTLKDKYYPLYSTISYSREYRTVNWNALYDERRYISAEYRFGHYHLYLDELLKLLLKIALSVYGPEGISRVSGKMKKYLELVDKNEIILKEMGDRVDKILEKLK